MRTQNLAQAQSLARRADVAMPQAGALGIFACQSGALSAIVHTGPSDLAYVSQWGPAQGTALQENRSRGCRAPKSPYWPCAWSLSLRVAQRKLKKRFTLTNRLSPPSRPSPANTSNPDGRALRAAQALPALSLSAAAQAEIPHSSANRFASARGLAYLGRTIPVTFWSFPCGPLSLSPCLHLQPLQPARSPRPSRSPLRCRSNRNRPANTSNQTGQAPHGSAPFARLPLGKAATC